VNLVLRSRARRHGVLLVPVKLSCPIADTTTTQFSTIDSHLAAWGFSSFTLYSFIFTTDPTHPKITFIYTCTQNSVPIKEQIVLTLSDGSTGWLVSAVDSQEQ